MNPVCPSCRQPLMAPKIRRCPHCSCEVAMLGTITGAARDSLKLAIGALREGRDRDAHEFAYESWGLHQTKEAAAAGLIAATGLGDPIEIPRWIRRRRSFRP